MIGSRGTTYIRRLGARLGAVEDAEVRRLIGAMHERHLALREAVFVAGESATSIYFVASGCIMLSVAGRGERDTTIDLLREGDILGEMALVEDGIRRQSAHAAAPSTIIAIPLDSFTMLMRQRPAFAVAIATMLAQRISTQQQLIQRLTSQSVSSRLAQLLLDEMERADGASVLHLRLTHHQISQLIGTSRETVSALLRRFVKLDLIDYNRLAVTVLDAERLGHYASGELYISAR